MTIEAPDIIKKTIPPWSVPIVINLEPEKAIEEIRKLGEEARRLNPPKEPYQSNQLSKFFHH